jgi:hypothetical protein
VNTIWQYFVSWFCASLSSTAGTPPRKVFLFSGHMIDAPDRAQPRFPPSMEPDVTKEIAGLLASLQAGAADLAICGGACGGDLIFAERALARDVPLQLYLPFDVPQFIKTSVDFASGDWLRRFEAVRKKAHVDVMRASRTPSDGSTSSPYELNNLRMLERALCFGAGKLEFICLWDGKKGDGPGGTEHLIAEVRQAGGQPHLIDPHQLRP